MVSLRTFALVVMSLELMPQATDSRFLRVEHAVYRHC
jgi:hypothetical protein